MSCSLVQVHIGSQRPYPAGQLHHSLPSPSSLANNDDNGLLAHDDSGGLLHKIREIDYLAPIGDTVDYSRTSDYRGSARHSPRRGISGSNARPVFQKVVLSREELLEKLQELKELQNSDRDTESNMLRQLVEQVIENS